MTGGGDPPGPAAASGPGRTLVLRLPAGMEVHRPPAAGGPSGRRRVVVRPAGAPAGGYLLEEPLRLVVPPPGGAGRGGAEPSSSAPSSSEEDPSFAASEASTVSSPLDVSYTAGAVKPEAGAASAALTAASLAALRDEIGRLQEGMDALAGLSRRALAAHDARAAEREAERATEREAERAAEREAAAAAAERLAARHEAATATLREGQRATHAQLRSLQAALADRDAGLRAELAALARPSATTSTPAVRERGLQTDAEAPAPAGPATPAVTCAAGCQVTLLAEEAAAVEGGGADPATPAAAWRRHELGGGAVVFREAVRAVAHARVGPEPAARTAGRDAGSQTAEVAPTSTRRAAGCQARAATRGAASAAGRAAAASAAAGSQTAATGPAARASQGYGGGPEAAGDADPEARLAYLEGEVRWLLGSLASREEFRGRGLPAGAVGRAVAVV